MPRIAKHQYARRIHDRDDGGALLGTGDIRRAWPPDPQDNIGVLNGHRGAGRDHGPGCHVVFIRNARFKSGASLDPNLRAETNKFLNRLGRRSDTALSRIIFGRNGDQHEWLPESLRL